MCPDQKSTRGVDSITLMLCLFFRAKRNGKLLAPKQLYLGIKIEQETERAICIHCWTGDSQPRMAREVRQQPFEVVKLIYMAWVPASWVFCS